MEGELTAAEAVVELAAAVDEETAAMADEELCDG